MATKETAHWHKLYRSESAISRRVATLPRKLALLGLDRAPRSAAILDVCCGEGETLSALHGMGFRELHGIDLELSPALGGNPNFKTTRGDATATGLPTASYDWILCIHSLHHLTTPEKIEAFLTECKRLLKPNGRVALIDFFDSPQTRLALNLLRVDAWRPFPYVNFLSELVREEWVYLSSYFKTWPKTRSVLFKPNGFKAVSRSKGLFYFYLVLEKTESGLG